MIFRDFSASDEQSLVAQAIVHGAGTAAQMQADEPIHGNAINVVRAAVGLPAVTEQDPAGVLPNALVAAQAAAAKAAADAVAAKAAANAQARADAAAFAAKLAAQVAAAYAMSVNVVITQAYRTLLLREPDAGGLAGWTAWWMAKHSAGEGDAQINAELTAAFQASAEYIALHTPPPSGGGGPILDPGGGRNMRGFHAFGDDTYIVQPGDTLTGIALKLGLCKKGSGNTTADWSDCLAAAYGLADINSLPDVDSIQVGQILSLVKHGTSPAGAPVPVVRSPSWLKWLALGVAGLVVYKGMRS